ncbi:hypothetical protein ACE6H2_025276 [Prunus campanulata]
MDFEQFYRCYSVSSIGKPHAENGDKIIMPPSALHRLVWGPQVAYPMLFQLNNPNSESGRVTHCGVLEFVADEGFVFLPSWMMHNLLLQEGNLVQVKSQSLGKGTYVKLQPHTKDFFDISNPKAALETALRTYSCLTTGDTIMLPYNSKKYYINIIETKPSSAICIVDTDCEVDFAPPLDYVEPEKKPVPSTLPTKRPQEVEEDEQETPEKIAKFRPFTGSARRLNGEPVLTQSVAHAVPSPPELKQRHQLESENGTNKKGSKSSASASLQHSGKLVFGSNVNRPANATPKVAPNNSSRQEPPHKSEEPKLQAFTGKKYTLKG